MRHQLDSDSSRLGSTDDDSDGQAAVHRAVKDALTKPKRDHHHQRHLHHRRRHMRAQLKQARVEAAQRAALMGIGAGGEDDAVRAPPNEEDMIRLGSYTTAERQRKIQRFLEKRRRRVWSKKILYSCRKSFADRRPRVGGRFVKLHDSPSLHGEAGEGAGAGIGGAGSLGTSPALSGLHMPLGLHAALTQHMHGVLGGHPLLTAFSLPLAPYAHFGPLAAGAQNAAAVAAAAAAAAANPTLGVLSFLKQEAPSASAAAAAAAPSGLSAALRSPISGLAAQLSPLPPAHASPQPPLRPPSQ